MTLLNFLKFSLFPFFSSRIAFKEVYENWEFQGEKLMKGIQNEEICSIWCEKLDDSMRFMWTENCFGNKNIFLYFGTGKSLRFIEEKYILEGKISKKDFSLNEYWWSFGQVY